MSTQKGVIHVSPGVSELRTDLPLPKLSDNQSDWVLIKTKAVALNPTDWKNIVKANYPGALVGCDYAGVVQEVGKEVKRLKVGDRVAGFVRGGDLYDHTNGAFAQHIKAREGINLKFNDNISFEDAATLGVGITTVGQGLYQTLGLPLPPSKVSSPTPLFIYGGSTATGTLAIQYAKLTGAEVFTTSSPRNFELLHKLGADHVFDYNEPNVGAKIREASHNKIKLAYDCIAEGSSVPIVADALSSEGGKLVGILPIKDFPRDDVKPVFTFGYTALGQKYNDKWPASEEDRDFGVRFWKISEDLVNSGKIKTHPIDVRGGLEGVPQGLKDLEAGKASGAKFVYRID